MSQEDFSGGVATFLVKFDAPPAVPMAAIKKEVGKYTIDKVGMKLTGKATEKKDVWHLGNVALTGDMTSKVAELKGKVIIVTGTLTEDKGRQSLDLASVDELPKKK
ncbi:MAG TPA: hypothetical protein VEJ18_02735 [Planctomycetota bacterium]|nr:hypothetical protein [Planctomycetota bacterium]